MPIIAKNLLRFLLIILAFGISLYAMEYLSFKNDTGILHEKPKYIIEKLSWKIAFYLHIIGGIIALTTGPFQFFPKLRNNNLGIHRFIGKIYVFSIFIASPMAFYSAFFTLAGPIAQSGFALLAVCWFFTTWKAYTTIRRGDIENHKKWMFRSYATTMAAITLRIWLPLETMAFGMTFNTAYQIVAWLCWVPNIILVEILIRRKILV